MNDCTEADVECEFPINTFPPIQHITEQPVTRPVQELANTGASPLDALIIASVVVAVIGMAIAYMIGHWAGMRAQLTASTPCHRKHDDCSPPHS